MPLLDIRNLTIEFMTAAGPVKAVDRVTLSLTEGEFRGLAVNPVPVKSDRQSDCRYHQR